MCTQGSRAKALRYKRLAHKAFTLGRYRAAARLEFLAAYCSWLAARQLLGLVNGDRKAQGRAMSRLHYCSAVMRRAWARLQDG